MDNILYLLLGIVIVVVLFSMFNGMALVRGAGTAVKDVAEDAGDVLEDLTKSAGKLVGLGGKDDKKVHMKVGEGANRGDGEMMRTMDIDVCGDQGCNMTNEMMSVPDLGQGAPMGPAGSLAIPMTDMNMGYPSGILPGAVGTFHPTRNCDRFTCDGCTTCAENDGGCQAITDDAGRNYPALIDTIRASRTDEYPFYKMS